jgi:hypothetical protein
MSRPITRTVFAACAILVVLSLACIPPRNKPTTKPDFETVLVACVTEKCKLVDEKDKELDVLEVYWWQRVRWCNDSHEKVIIKFKAENFWGNVQTIALEPGEERVVRLKSSVEMGVYDYTVYCCPGDWLTCYPLDTILWTTPRIKVGPPPTP